MEPYEGGGRWNVELELVKGGGLADRLIHGTEYGQQGLTISSFHGKLRLGRLDQE